MSGRGNANLLRRTEFADIWFFMVLYNTTKFIVSKKYYCLNVSFLFN